MERQRNEAWEAQEEEAMALLAEVHYCERARSAIRGEMALMEHVLLDLEETFSKFRRKLIARDTELSTAIAEREQELAELNASIVERREAAHAADSRAIAMEQRVASANLVLRPQGW